MKKWVLWLALLAALPLIFQSAAADTLAQPRYIANQYIVTLDRSKTKTAFGLVAAVQNALSLVGGGDVLAYYTDALPGVALRLNPWQAQLLLRMPGVINVEQDQEIWASATQTPAQYNLDRIDQRGLPLSQGFNYSDNPAAGVHVYIIDTGLNASHTDFAGRVGNGRNFAPRYFGSVSSADTSDCNGHGTHVAGIAAGTVYGVAKRATLHPVRVLDCGGGGSLSGFIAGIDWVLANRLTPAVANLSLGGSASSTLDQVVRNLVAAGITTAVAAGNENENACGTSPAREPTALTVGSTTSSDARSSFSNFGTCVDLFAPGSNIVSASNSSNTGTRTLSGTSMASPLAAGAAAVYLGRNPSATPAQVNSALIAAATQSVITSVGTGSPNRLLYLAAENSPSPVNQPPVGSFSFQCTGTSCSFNGAGSTDDVGVTNYSWNFGDGDQDSGAAVTHQFAQAGTFNVTLTVADGGGLTDSESRSVTVTAVPVNGPPTAAFSVICTGAQCSFNASASSADVVSYAWSFGDSGTGSGVSPSHTYAASGTFQVSLTVRDDIQQQDVESRSIVVTLPPSGSAPCDDCVRSEGRLISTRASEYPGGSNGFSFAGGTLAGYLTGPAGADFDLYLERSGSRSSWTVVASATTAGSTHELSAVVASGTYRWRISSKSGTGDFVFYSARRP